MSDARHPDAAVLARLQESTQALTSAALERLTSDLPWYSELESEPQGAIEVLARAGVTSFLRSFHSPGTVISARELLASAPPELTRAISLHQTLDLLRVIVDTVESKVSEYVPEEQAIIIRMAALRFSRDIAFSAAQAYARAAESRGAWDARLEATVVDALLRGTSDETVLSRTSALGWSGSAYVSGIVAGSLRPTSEEEALPDNVTPLPGQELPSANRASFGPETTTRLRRIARRARADLLLSVQGRRLVLVVGAHSSDHLETVTSELIAALGDVRLAMGPAVTDVREAGASLRPAVAALQAAAAWPQAPRPLHADDVLPERALQGDEIARRILRERVYLPLRDAQSPLLTTLDAYWSNGTALEATARELFVHTNTVRYRLHRVEDLIGWDPTDAREGFVIRMGVAIGRLYEISAPDATNSGP